MLQAFRLMRKKGIGGLPVVDRDGKKAVGNISIRDLRFLLTMPEIYKDYRLVISIIIVNKNCLSMSSVVCRSLELDPIFCFLFF